MNTEKAIMTFRSYNPDMSKKFNYQFVELNMIFLRIDGKEELEFEKR